MPTSRPWIVAAALSVVAWAAVLLAAQAIQTRQLADSTATLLQLKQASTDLDEAFLHVQLSGDAASPWQRAQGMALLSQAAAEIDRIGHRIGAGDRAVEVTRAVEALRQRIAEPGDVQSRQAIQPRLMLHEIRKQLAALDALAAKQSRSLARRMNNLFAAVLAMSALLVGAVFAGLIRSERARSRALATIEAGDARLRSTLAALAEGVLVFDAQGRLLDFNPSAQRLLGMDLAQLRARPPDADRWPLCRLDGTPLPPDELPLAQVLSSGAARHDQLIGVQVPDRGLRAMSVNTEPLLDGRSGAVRGAVLSFSDVTQARQLATQLEEDRQLLEARVAQRTRELADALAAQREAERFTLTVTDSIPSLVAYWDRDLRCGFANNAYRAWFDVQPQDLPRLKLPELLGPQRWAETEPMVLAALRGERQDFVRDTTRPHGGQARTLASYVPHVVNDQVHGFIVVANDVTPLKQAEDELERLNADLARRAHQAEAATRAKSAFLANMSHEIRTPMNAIIGLTHLMSHDSTDAQQRERLRKVDGAARHLLQVINDVLDLSKIEAGRMRLESIEFSRDELLGRALEMVSDAARLKGLELVLDAGRLPERMVGDPKHLAQALINLLSNAVKFTEQGWVRLHAEVAAEEGDRLQLRLEVSDSGIGIQAERLPQLFTAFEQGDNSTTRRYGGTGLGLALTRNIAELMGGAVGVQSEPGVGSRFWMTAWLTRVRPSAGAERGSAWQGQRALVVDDLPESQQALGEQLRWLGMQVTCMADGAGAVDWLAEGQAAGRRCDLLLIDWRMPGLNGIDTLARARQLLGQDLPPAILVSAHDEPAMWRQARQARFDAVLVKPITSSSLHDTLTQLLGPPEHRHVRLARSGQDPAEQLRRRPVPARVLLVEDNAVNQEVARELLLSVGIEVDQATHGMQAIQAVGARRPDLVLMDVQMPVMDGLEATRTLRRQGHTTLPIIAMTANAFGEDRAQCLAAGMNDHVGKPVDPPQLFATLLRWLSDGPVPEGQDTLGAEVPDRAMNLELALASVPGLDLGVAMQNLAGQIDIVERVLRRFVASYRLGEPGFQAPWTPERAKAWAEACHSLRGACATVGASALAADLREFEQQLAAPGSAGPHLALTARRIQDNLLALVTSLDAALGIQDPAGPGSG